MQPNSNVGRHERGLENNMAAAAREMAVIVEVGPDLHSKCSVIQAEIIFAG